MRKRNRTPLLLAAKPTSRRPPSPEATLVVKGTFRIVPGGVVEAIGDPTEQLMLSGDLYAEADDDRVGECTYASDFADLKLNAEVLFRGSCHAPHGRPVGECPVLLGVGGWSKALRVIGPRFWSDGLIENHTDPVPFKTMPILWANAFGGARSRENPAGQGLASLALPTIEAAGGPVRSRTDRPSPGAFGPINPRWSARARKVGKEYGKAWLRERFPYYATDFDWSYFSAALPDQQLPGYFTGDEEIVLQNLSPLAPIVKTRLPGLLPRVFVEDDAKKGREVPLVLDTVFVDGDLGLVALTWRGVGAVREDDLTDLLFALVVMEDVKGPHRPAGEYLAELRAFAEDPLDLESKLPAGLPRDFLETRGAMNAEAVDEGVAPDPISAILDARLGDLGQEPRDRLRAMLAPVLEDGEKRAKIQEAVRRGEAGAADVPPIPRSGGPGTFPELHLRRRMRPLVEQASKVRAAVAGRELAPAQAKQLEELEKVPFHPKLKVLDPSYEPPIEPISSDEPGPGRDLSEQDLTGRDLSGRNLRGAKLRQAILTRANLRGADLTGADLYGAVLFKADATGATFDGADLTRANAARLVADGASFLGAKIGQTFFDSSSLSSANFARASGEYPVFTHCNLNRASFEGARVVNADFGVASLERARFAGTTADKASFTGVLAAKIDLTDAMAEGATFAGADLADARLFGLSARRACFSKTRLVRVDASFAILVDANLERTDLTAAKLFGANLAGARLRRAKLDKAEVVKANLFGADLSKASVNETKFSDSNLYEATLIGASGAGADFVGANLKMSTLERLT